MTWRNKNNEFTYTDRTSTGRDQIEQITTKKFNQNAYLDKIDSENTFWLQHFDHFNFFCEGTQSQYKNFIEPPNKRAGYIVQWFNYLEDAFILDEEKAIKKIYFDSTKRLNLLQESYFIYDRSFLVKPTFISELNKFLPVFCLVISFSKKKKEKKSKIILATNQKRFFIKKLTEKSEFLVQIANVSEKRIETANQKVHTFQLTMIGKKGRQE